MVNMSAIRLYAAAAMSAALLVSTPAFAQYRPQPIGDPSPGENYHIEFSAAYWYPSADIGIASAGSGALAGIAGTTIDFKNDLGLTDQHFPQLKLVLRASKRNKFRAELIPIKYEQAAQLNRTVVFNGQRYNIGLPVNSSLDWKAWRFAYEFDIISRDRGYLGIVLDAKYTAVSATLTSPLAAEFAHAKAPIPAIGAIGRVYVVPYFSVTAELTGFKVPDIGSQTIGGIAEPKYRAHYADFDLYGTLNFTNYIGAQLGYRVLDLGYLVNADSGTLTMKGLYFGAVVRY